MHRLYAKTFQLFASLKLTLVIMIGMAMALFTGMFWDQTQTLEKHLEAVQSPIARKLFLFLELNDVFHSWWFGILVLLLALNLIACSIARLPKIWIDCRNPVKKLDLKKLPLKVILQVSSVKTPIFGPKEETWVENNTLYVFFEKQKYARCGVYVIHTALLFMMFGSIIATQAGVDGMMLIPEGRYEHLVSAKGPGGSLYSHELGFAVSCVDFRLKTYTDGSPMAYESDLAIFDKNDLSKPIITKTIKVNDPLEYQGYTFYQASYQALQGEKRLNLKIGPHGGVLKNYQVKPGEKIGDITPTEVYEDYAGLGSAVAIKQGDTEFVVFRKYPDFDSQVRRGDLDIIYQGFDEPYATGISVGKVPCVSFVFAGFVIMFVGLFMAFCMNQRRYYAKITPLENGKFELVLGGISNRYPQAFEQEF
ncbi:MAG: cytochrome c biogenesis protein ResB, partial [Myxococcaceae bacterium]